MLPFEVIAFAQGFLEESELGLEVTEKTGSVLVQSVDGQYFRIYFYPEFDEERLCLYVQVKDSENQIHRIY